MEDLLRCSDLCVVLRLLGGCEALGNGWTGSELFQNRMLLHAAMRTHCAQWAAGQRNGIAVRALERIPVLHEATTDAGADRHIYKEVTLSARAKNCFGQSGGADVRFDPRRGNFRESLLHRDATPVNRATAGDVAIAIHQLGDAGSNALYLNSIF